MDPAPMPAIAALYAALVVLMLLGLALPISRLRRIRRIGIGDGGDRDLARPFACTPTCSSGACLPSCCC